MNSFEDYLAESRPHEPDTEEKLAPPVSEEVALPETEPEQAETEQADTSAMPPETEQETPDAETGRPAAETAQPVPEAACTAVQARKGFPAFAVPAMVMLSMMLLVFLLELLNATGLYQLLPIMRGRYEGTSSFSILFNTTSFSMVLGNTVTFRLVELLVCGGLAAALCALCYTMRKPRAALGYACFWLIPACVPYLSTLLPNMRALYTNGGGSVLYLVTTLLQTTGMFCFSGGLFAFLNLRKKGRIGGSPYFGLLVAALVWMLGALSINKTSSINQSGIRMTVDGFIYHFGLARAEMMMGSAAAVVKVVLQVLLALVPMVVLCILARRKSTQGRTPLTVLWIFLVLPVGAVLQMILPAVLQKGQASWGTAVLNSFLITLTGGAFGGLVAYSFLHLQRRVPAFLYGVFAVMLAASGSCLVSLYSLMRVLGIVGTNWPGTLLSAFDGRLVLLVSVLAFSLRDSTENSPGRLALAFALLSGAFAWGELFSGAVFAYRIVTVPLLCQQYMSRSPEVPAAGLLLLTIPPLLLGIGAMLLMRGAFGDRKPAQPEFR